MSQLRNTFDSAADLYLSARPQYPIDLYNQVAQFLPPGGQLLEVGCGPGLATRPFAERGFRITGVDPGANLLAAANRHLEGMAVTLVHGDFETVAAPVAAFDGVYAATAWHWLDPQQRYRKAAEVLVPGGILAFWEARHVFPDGGDPIFQDLQAVYEEIGESLPEDTVFPRPGELPTSEQDISQSGWFQLAHLAHFDWQVEYSSEQYIQLLRTFSGHIAMPAWKQERLFSTIREYSKARTPDRIRRHWGCVLHIARKVAHPGPTRF